MAHCFLYGEFGLSSGFTPPLPLPTNTPGPIWTDDLLPMMTLGCSDAALDLVPSGHRMASPLNTPVRPSSHVTAGPLRVQFWAMAGEAASRAAAAAAINMRMVRLQVLSRSSREMG